MTNLVKHKYRLCNEFIRREWILIDLLAHQLTGWLSSLVNLFVNRLLSIKRKITRRLANPIILYYTRKLNLISFRIWKRKLRKICWKYKKIYMDYAIHGEWKRMLPEKKKEIEDNLILFRYFFNFPLHCWTTNFVSDEIRKTPTHCHCLFERTMNHWPCSTLHFFLFFPLSLSLSLPYIHRVHVDAKGKNVLYLHTMHLCIHSSTYQRTFVYVCMNHIDNNIRIRNLS